MSWFRRDIQILDAKTQTFATNKAMTLFKSDKNWPCI
jgi:hypothetical protein